MTKKKTPLRVGDLPKTTTKTKKSSARKQNPVDAKGAYGFVSKNLENKTKPAAAPPTAWKKWLGGAQQTAETLLEKAKQWPQQNLPKTWRNKLDSVSSNAKAALRQIETKHLLSVPFYQQKIRPLWAGK